MILSKEDQQLLQDTLREAREIMLADMNKNFKCIDQGPVDGEPWYTIQIQNQDIWFWLTQQEGSWHYYHSEAHRMPLVDMDEKMFLALTMTWS